ncbi:hypothetical protein RRG08_012035 [Elysia crispata]|uniref:Uncharacterized protein n=1 Tax=Elysia crispata TaxID=231223 RepID=A0AAE1CN13_9GAST|nr:hypothetical protein RRG08_012035 [Elysia crispata]
MIARTDWAVETGPTNDISEKNKRGETGSFARTVTVETQACATRPFRAVSFRPNDTDRFSETDSKQMAVMPSVFRSGQRAILARGPSRMILGIYHSDLYTHHLN